MNHSFEELAAVASTYWPSSMEAQLRPETCPQFARLHERWQHELAHIDQWRSFLGKLKADLPGFVVGDATTTVDASFRCAVYPQEANNPPQVDWAVVGCVSILAPVYTTYAVQYALDGKRRVSNKVFFDSLPSAMRGLADAVSKRIEATFESSALAREVAETRVHLFVEPQRPPHTTLFHALFTSEPESLP